MNEFESDCLAYIKEISADSVVSRSHWTLNCLYQKYGKENVDKFLDNHFSKK